MPGSDQVVETAAPLRPTPCHEVLTSAGRREEMSLNARSAKAADQRTSPRSQQAEADLADLERRAGESLDRVPADLVRARALVAAYVAYLGSARDHRHHSRPAAGGQP